MLEQEYYLTLVLLNSKIFSCLYKLVYIRAFVNVNMKLENFFRVFVCDIFNRHATFRAIYEDSTTCFTVKYHT